LKLTVSKLLKYFLFLKGPTVYHKLNIHFQQTPNIHENNNKKMNK